MSTRGIGVQGEEIIATARDLAWQIWPERLVAAYALGSLAHGGFSAVSDVDLGLVLADPLLRTDADGVIRLAQLLKATTKPFADRLSVFWGSVATLSGVKEGGRFPPLDRLDLITYGRLLTGSDIRRKLSSPTRKELVIAGAEFALSRLGTGEIIAKLKDPRALLRSDAKTLTKLVLYPVRFLFTARTGEVGRNDAAVAHFAGSRNNAATTLARMALGWRNAAPASSDQAASEAIAAGVLPLYREFLVDHERRLREFARPDLAEAFARWRQRLQA
jgi:hypothetical protein